jgi:hypothetical protein
MVQTQTAAGAHDVETYLINIGLPNGIGFQALKVSKANLGAGLDVLIGMDIISSGDFSITNHNNSTVFSFRVPSSHTIDFVKEHQEGMIRLKMAQSGKGGFRQGKKKR